MPRLIEVENVIRVIDRYISDGDTNLNIKLAITNIPTVDAEPVRHGRWTVTPVFIKCSECGESFMLIPQNYCPNCGAKMDGERRKDAETN